MGEEEISFHENNEALPIKKKKKKLKLYIPLLDYLGRLVYIIIQQVLQYHHKQMLGVSQKKKKVGASLK